MRNAVVAAVVITSAMLATGCAPVQQSSSSYASSAPSRTPPHVFKPIEFKPKADRSAAWNYQAQLDAPVFQCHLEADGGFSLYRMGIRSAPDTYGPTLNECRIFARSMGDQAVSAFKQAGPTPKMMDLGKDLYAKWSTYIGSMSVYAPVNQETKLAYQSVRDAFLAEEKFSN